MKNRAWEASLRIAASSLWVSEALLVFLVREVQVVERPRVGVLELLPQLGLLGLDHVLHAEGEVAGVEEASGHVAEDLAQLVVVSLALGFDNLEDFLVVGFGFGKLLHFEMHFGSELLDGDHFFELIEFVWMVVL